MTAVLPARRVRVPSCTFLICIGLMLAGENAVGQAITVSPNPLTFSVTQGGSQTNWVTISNISTTEISLRLELLNSYYNEFYVPLKVGRLQEGQSAEFEVVFMSNGSRLSDSAVLAIEAVATDYSISDTKYVDLTATVSFDCSGTVATASGGGAVTKGAVALLKGAGGASCSWEPTTDLTDPLSCTTFAAPVATTTYTLTVTNTNGTCSATDDVTVQVVDVSSPPTGSLPQGSILMLMHSMPAPDGYSYLGASTISYGTGKTKTTIQVDVYSKD